MLWQASVMVMSTPQPFPAVTARSPHAPPGGEARQLEQALRVQRVGGGRGSWMPPSVRRVAESRWTPAAITALIGVLVPLAVAWVASSRDDVARQAREASARLERVEQELRDTSERLAALQEATRLRTGELQDALDKAATAARARTSWEDVAWCAVGVRAPSGCAEVELLPRPMKRSTAPPIQVRARDP